MNDLRITIRRTNELSDTDIVVINTLKNQYWSHTEEEHMKWFKKNLRPEDKHLQLWGGVTTFSHI